MPLVTESVQAFMQGYKDKKIAVAVSGGSDSLALLYALYEERGTDNLLVFHFDHNLRAESKTEAEQVSAICARMGVPCAVRTWEEPNQKPASGHNLLQRARQARYAAFRELSVEYGAEAVCVGHTADDVAESFIMRLGRGSGLSGLASMRREGEVLGVNVLRPVLNCSRADLKQYLESRGQEWINDPSNNKDQYLRVRVRQSKEAFEKIGLPFDSLFASANALRRSEDALNAWCDQLWEQLVQKSDKGGLLLSCNFWAQTEEMQLRLLSRVMVELTGDALSPRTSKRQNLMAMMAAENTGKWTLGGVIFEKKKTGSIACVPEDYPELLRVEALLKQA